jgi:PucR C-terminal helix-turn-helix domain
MSVLTHEEVVRRIVARADIERFTDRVLESFWETPEFQRLRPPRDEVRATVRWNLDLVIRWLTEGRGPTEAELAVFREQAQARAADGIPPDIVPANFRRGARFAWDALLAAASEEERPALLASAGLLLDFVDRVSRIFSEVYDEATRAAPQLPDEVSARGLLARLAADEPPAPEDRQLAERIGLDLDQAARPLVVACPGCTAQQHLELAARLRRHGALAASEGRRIVGLSATAPSWSALELPSTAIIALGTPAVRGERGRALDDLRIAVDAAAARGRSGEIAPDDYLAELLLRRSPRIAARIAQRVYGPLGPELMRTLDALVQRDFERAATAAALPVHRNTLRDRINHISELSGIDLDSAEGRAMAWLAWLTRSPR